MKKILVLILCCLTAGAARAYDFALPMAGGQTLYFNITGGSVEVTYPNATAYPVNGWDGFTRPVGTLQIPSTVVHNGVAYPVTALGQLAFYGCTGLTSVVIGDGIVALGNSAFNGCSMLSTVVIPASVDTIGSQTFAYCPSLSQVWVGRPQPPRTSAFAFYNTTLSSSTLHVLPTSTAAYAAATPWSDFGTLQGDGPTLSLTVGVNDPQGGTVTGGGAFTVGSSVTIGATAADGYSFVCWNDGDMQNPRTLTLTESRHLVAVFLVPLHDTVETHDTVYQHDTSALERYRLQVFSSQGTLGVGVGTTEVPEGTVVEICALPLDGGRFSGWSDGVAANPRRVTVTGEMTFTAFFEQLGIDSHLASNGDKWRVHTEGREVVVMNATGMNIVVYDAVGRQVVTAVAAGETHRMTLPTAGVYVVRVGDWGVVKVTVE